jgi:hypothetical protein
MSFLKNFKKEQRAQSKKKKTKKTSFTQPEIEKAEKDFKNFKKYEMSNKPYKSNYVLAYDEKIYQMIREKYPTEVTKIEQELIERKPWLKNRGDLLYEQTNKAIFPHIILAGEQSTDKAPERYVMSLDEITAMGSHEGALTVYKKKRYSSIIPKGQRFNKNILNNITVDEAFTLLLDILEEHKISDLIDEADLEQRDLLCLLFRRDPVNMSYEDFCMANDIHLDELYAKMDEIKINILKDYVEDDILKKILKNGRKM